MDKIINYLLLVIIFVFDPLAISLVVAANFAFANAFPKQEEDVLAIFDNDEEFEEWEDEIESEIQEEVVEDIEVEAEEVKGDSYFLSKLDEIEERMIKDNAIIEEEKKGGY